MNAELMSVAVSIGLPRGSPSSSTAISATPDGMLLGPVVSAADEIVPIG